MTPRWRRRGKLTPLWRDSCPNVAAIIEHFTSSPHPQKKKKKRKEKRKEEKKSSTRKESCAHATRKKNDDVTRQDMHTADPQHHISSKCQKAYKQFLLLSHFHRTDNIQHSSRPGFHCRNHTSHYGLHAMKNDKYRYASMYGSTCPHK